MARYNRFITSSSSEDERPVMALIPRRARIKKH